MALGGGTYTSTDKGLPGSYINFTNASRASADTSSRGIATMPLALDWGPDKTVFEVTAESFKANCRKTFGYSYGADGLKGLRDLFGSIRKAYFYRLNNGGAKADCTYATAKYAGTRGNALKIIIEAAEGSTVSNPLYDVTTLMDNVTVDVQTGVAAMSALTDNDYVSFKASATIALTAGTTLSGGTNGTETNTDYQDYLDAMEQYSFNTMGCLTTESTVKALFANYTKRMRDEHGVKFQCVLFRHTAADYEGVVSVENGLADSTTSPEMVYWATGALAGCSTAMSLTNALYTGSFAPDTGSTQTELEAAIKAGKFMFHRVGSEIRVLEDVNTLVTVTDAKTADFASNQTIRVLDQIGNDIAAVFNTKYLGKIANNPAGRQSLWNDIVKHHKQMQTDGAIEDYASDDTTVEAGSAKRAVVVTDYVTPVSSMERLYMTVYVE